MTGIELSVHQPSIQAFAWHGTWYHCLLSLPISLSIDILSNNCIGTNAEIAIDNMLIPFDVISIKTTPPKNTMFSNTNH
jgi:hypothetical protein